MTGRAGRKSRPESAAGAADQYAGLASIYDRLMRGVDYDGWADYVEALLERCGCRPRRLVDLACGTGASTLPFARRGYRATGVDLSAAMLQRARAKARSLNLPAAFLQRDLRCLNLPRHFDLALLFQDGLNYLLREEDLASAFREVAAVLVPGGLFIFDLCRPGRRVSGGGGSSWAEDEDFTLLWESRFHTESDLWEAAVTIFVRRKDGLYRRVHERHYERDYEPAKVEKLLAEAGFTVRTRHPSFSLAAPRGGEAKLTFVAAVKTG